MIQAESKKITDILDKIERLIKSVKTGVTDQNGYSYSLAVLQNMENIQSNIQSIQETIAQPEFIQLKTHAEDLSEKLTEVNGKLMEVRKEFPDLHVEAVRNYMELLQTCHDEGLSNTEQIKKMISDQKELEQKTREAEENAEAKKHLKEITSVLSNTQTELSRVQGEANEKTVALTQLESKKAELDAELEQTKGLLTKVNEQLKDAKKEAGENASAKRQLEEAQRTIESQEKSLKDFQPDGFDWAPINEFLKDDNAKKAMIMMSLLQLYWYSKAVENPQLIEGFRRFDDLLFNMFDSDQDKLEHLRNDIILPILMNKIFSGTDIEIRWPKRGDKVFEHEDWYYRENKDGNQISRIKTAMIFNNGKLEFKARVFTSIN